MASWRVNKLCVFCPLHCWNPKFNAKYPDNLVNSTISRFVAAKASDQHVSSPAVSDRSDPIRVVLQFKDQASADIVHSQLKDLSQKIQTTGQPVFVRQKIGRDLKLREAKPPIVNQQCLVYKFKCDLCDAGLCWFHTPSSSLTGWRTQLKALHHQLASIFTKNILWFQRISQRTSAF